MIRFDIEKYLLIIGIILTILTPFAGAIVMLFYSVSYLSIANAVYILIIYMIMLFYFMKNVAIVDYKINKYNKHK